MVADTKFTQSMGHNVGSTANLCLPQVLHSSSHAMMLLAVEETKSLV